MADNTGDYSEAAVLALLRQHGETLVRIEQNQEDTAKMLNGHLVKCASTHGDVGTRLSRVEDRTEAWPREYSRMSGLIEDISDRTRRLENHKQRGEDAQLSDKVKNLQDWKATQEKKQARDDGAKSVWFRVWPYLATAAGSVGASELLPEIMKRLS